MTKCECQLCGKMKKTHCFSPENKETTFRLFGIKGHSLPLCLDCMVKKNQNPEFMLKSLEEFARMLKLDLAKQKKELK